MVEESMEESKKESMVKYNTTWILVMLEECTTITP